MRQFPLRRPCASALLFGLCVVLAGCGAATGGDELGEAYVAPATLNLRREIAQKNDNVAVLKHGERVSIIDVRRRFVKIRTSKRQEGWVDSLQLLSTEQMDELRRANQRALSLPSEGAATVFEPLNIHTQPDRQSPAFARIDEGVSVSVLSHKLSPKTSEQPKPPSLIHEHPQPSSRRSHRERPVRNLKLPPPPPPPKPPANWQELSAEKIEGHETPAALKKRLALEAAARKLAALQKPVPLEDWTLVRTKDNQSGWVLSRNLVMSIPDDVAQYAEGRRITSYFDLGSVNDEEKGVRHDWLWTTASEQFSYDFNGWRVFIWNRRRHRYETSYRQHDVEGYYPIRVDPVDPNGSGRTFHLITKDDDGKFRTRTYAFDGSRVHLTATEDYFPGGKPAIPSAKALDTTSLQDRKPATGNWLSRQWQQLKSRFHRTT